MIDPGEKLLISQHSPDKQSGPAESSAAPVLWSRHGTIRRKAEQETKLSTPHDDRMACCLLLSLDYCVS